MASFSCAVSLTTRQQFGIKPPSSQPQRAHEPKHSQMCVCVFACMSDSTLCILADGETDMTLSYFLSGRISSGLSSAKAEPSSFFSSVLTCREPRIILLIMQLSVSPLPSCFTLFSSINEAPHQRWKQSELNLKLQLSCVFCGSVATIPK